LPFRIFPQVARNTAGDIAANAGWFLPGGREIGEFGAMIGSAGVAAISDAKEIKRMA
jgi:hypothetical protein